ncbi:replication initiator [Nonomuraea sp. NPDC049784]|uniref:replication initiator n=1 Tax=Nonomuraea sp. NPDC049784 TaxID=3154361 RepID=UPI0033E48D2E
MRVCLDVPNPCRRLCWGAVDVRPIQSSATDDTAISEAAVAGYVAKYATKAAETSGTLDRPVRYHDLARLERNGVTEHAARLIRTAWDLGNPEIHPDLAPLRLRQSQPQMARQPTRSPSRLNKGPLGGVSHRSVSAICEAVSVRGPPPPSGRKPTEAGNGSHETLFFVAATWSSPFVGIGPRPSRLCHRMP